MRQMHQNFEKVAPTYTTFCYVSTCIYKLNKCIYMIQEYNGLFLIYIVISTTQQLCLIIASNIIDYPVYAVEGLIIVLSWSVQSKIGKI